MKVNKFIAAIITFENKIYFHNLINLYSNDFIIQPIQKIFLSTFIYYYLFYRASRYKYHNQKSVIIGVERQHHAEILILGRRLWQGGLAGPVR